MMSATNGSTSLMTSQGHPKKLRSLTSKLPGNMILKRAQNCYGMETDNGLFQVAFLLYFSHVLLNFFEDAR
jgi:hypothetical protein